MPLLSAMIAIDLAGVIAIDLAGVIAINLAGDMLQVYRSTYAVSTENISKIGTLGTRSLWVGGAAVLLLNKGSDRRRAKYKLLHVVRTHRGSYDKAFRCLYQEQDDVGKVGVSLSKDLMTIAGGSNK